MRSSSASRARDKPNPRRGERSAIALLADSRRQRTDGEVSSGEQKKEERKVDGGGQKAGHTSRVEKTKKKKRRKKTKMQRTWRDINLLVARRRSPSLAIVASLSDNWRRLDAPRLSTAIVAAVAAAVVSNDERATRWQANEQASGQASGRHDTTQRVASRAHDTSMSVDVATTLPAAAEDDEDDGNKRAHATRLDDPTSRLTNRPTGRLAG